MSFRSGNQHGQLDDPRGREDFHQHLGQHAKEAVQTPTRLTEESVITAVMSFASATAGPNQLGHEAAAMGENPSRHQLCEDLKARLSENALKPG